MVLGSTQPGLYPELPPKDMLFNLTAGLACMHKPLFASNICVKGMRVPHVCRAVGILLILKP